ncbi:hypothetical protein EKO27_g9778 [Xylaria grammica]|uniref:Uncharacterized protein n=1 Tax=Xylaria grammica TaxID=363999 RepID=A0A439CT26_9PEZI|nr:hypothetical protein EKO27_g9778 [Xylaria grammica]
MTSPIDRSNASDASDASDSSDASSLVSIMRAGGDIYKMYRFALSNGVVGELEPPQAWLNSGWVSLDQFVSDARVNAPLVCFIRCMKPCITTRVAIHLAVRQISREEETLRDAAQYPVLYAEDRNSQHYEAFWESLVKDVAKILRPLTKDATKVEANADADRHLEAIEAVTELTSPSQPIQHYFFIAGLDRAYDRTLGVDRNWSYNIWSETPETKARKDEQYGLTPADISQRAKVKRMVDALIRLFRGKGKLVFIVQPSFSDFEVAGSMNDVPTYVL